MKEERRLVWRVLRHWTEIANGGRFPRRDEIDPWMLGEDGANLVLMAVQSPIELSHFLLVGVNLAVALCATDTLAGVLLSHVAAGGVDTPCSDDRGQRDASQRGHPLSRDIAAAV